MHTQELKPENLTLNEIANWSVTRVVTDETVQSTRNKNLRVLLLVNGVEQEVRLEFPGIIDDGNLVPEVHLGERNLWKVPSDSLLLRTLYKIKGIVYLSTDSRNTTSRGSWVN